MYQARHEHSTTGRHCLNHTYAIYPSITYTHTIHTGLLDFEVRLFAYQLLRALAWTHARGVIHRYGR
jgi:serine/threonine protein kinase